MAEITQAMLRTLLISAALAVQGCATTDELFAEYDDNFCHASDSYSEHKRQEKPVSVAAKSVADRPQEPARTVSKTIEAIAVMSSDNLPIVTVHEFIKMTIVPSKSEPAALAAAIPSEPESPGRTILYEKWTIPEPGLPPHEMTHSSMGLPSFPIGEGLVPKDGSSSQAVPADK